jgi:hypothetical protein
MPGEASGTPYGGRGDGAVTGLLSYFDSHGWLTDWYLPPRVHGKLHNWLRGRGWRIR